MKVGILLNRVTWEIKKIIKELEKKRISYALLNNQKIYFNLNKKKDLEEDFDLVLEQSLSHIRGLFSAKILETKGYKVLNSYKCLNLTGNKLLTSLKLIEENINTPITSVAFKKDSAIKALDDFVDYPTVIKPIFGSWGRLIAKLNNFNDAKNILETREILGNPFQKVFYLQEFISKEKSEFPTDVRVIVIGEECVAAMGRFSPDDDFRSNLALGGNAEKFSISEELEKICIKTSKAVHGEIVGIDLMLKENKFNVIEINGTPQFHGISNATQINIAEKIVSYIVNNYN